jgi:hypothetical protein
MVGIVSLSIYIALGAFGGPTRIILRKNTFIPSNYQAIYNDVSHKILICVMFPSNYHSCCDVPFL